MLGGRWGIFFDFFCTTQSKKEIIILGICRERRNVVLALFYKSISGMVTTIPSIGLRFRLTLTDADVELCHS